MPFVQNLYYEFYFTNHAKVKAAFRCGVDIHSDPIEACYCGRGPILTGGTETARLNIEGRRLDVVLVADNGRNLVITVLPHTRRFRTNQADHLATAFDVAYSIDPTLFPLSEIVQWRENWIENGGSSPSTLADLRRELRTRVNERNQLAAPVTETAFHENAGYLEKSIQLDFTTDQNDSESQPNRLPSNLQLTMGFPPGGTQVGRTNKGNHPILCFTECEVLEINCSEDTASDPWHEMVIKFKNEYFVPTTKIKHYIKQYRVGDTTIWGVKYRRDKIFLTARQESA